MHPIAMSDIDRIKELIKRCLDGVYEARKEFQELLGTMIYNYPRAFFRAEREEAADFYLYVFEKDRVFKRLKDFRGDNISFENYLRYFVLKNLYLEWLRHNKGRTVETVSYEEPLDCGAQEEGDCRSVSNPNERIEPNEASRVCSILEEEKFLILKLLCLDQYESVSQGLSARDIRLLAEQSGRSIGDTILLLDEIRASLAERNAEHQSTYDELNKVFMKSLSQQKRIAQLESEIEHLDNRHHRAKIEELHAEKAECERKLAWRNAQRQGLLEDMAKRTGTTPYKDLGRLLNWPPGTVSSKVARARKAFQNAYASIHDPGSTL